MLGVVLSVHLAMNAQVGAILNNPRMGNAIFWCIGAVTAIANAGNDHLVVAAATRERLATLDQLPSPYLTGEFDHIDLSAFESITAWARSRASGSI